MTKYELFQKEEQTIIDETNQEFDFQEIEDPNTVQIIDGLETVSFYGCQISDINKIDSFL